MINEQLLTLKLMAFIEELKLEPINILKSDQFHSLSMHLTEMFVGKDMKVGGNNNM